MMNMDFRFLRALLAPFLFCLGLLASVGEVAAQQRAPAPVAAANAYRLAVGDVIKVQVYQAADLALETRINEAGTISFPLIGSVSLAGLSIPEAERRIADALRTGNFVKQPQVTINVMQVRGHQVSVLGQVGKPGRYPLEMADMRLSDIVAMAGGVLPTGADLVVVSGMRDGRPFRSEVDMPLLFGQGRSDGDIVLRNGDVIWVERAPMIYVYGEVQRPGTIRLERNMTLMQVLASAGGLTQRGTERGIRINRRDVDGVVRVVEPKMSDNLRADDVVFVRESLF